ncbi:MAG: hypothetical protein WC639_04670 [Patescibacteria group bacterium]
MNKDFKLFQSEFKKWQQKFGLTGYKVYFEYTPLKGCFAQYELDQYNMVATVRLNSDDKNNPDKHVALSAKHEAIHLLIGKLDHLSRSRYIQPEETDEAVEELVFKLEELIR